MSVQLRPAEGILPLDKPVGPSSHDMVALARRELGIRKVGHTGTLDPLASGLLLLCVGRATRLAEYLGGFPKEYLATARLGEVTSTDDAEGEVIDRSEAWTELDRGSIEAGLLGLTGESLQTPPAYSAKKVGGETAYTRARRGEDVTLKAVPVTIHEIEVTRLEPPDVGFRVVCSTGTYVRAIARDLGERLGVGAHLTSLRRTAIGPFRVERALEPSGLARPASVEEALVSPLEALAHLPTVEVGEAEARRLQSGQALSLEEDLGIRGEAGFADAAELAVGFDSRLIAVAVRDGDRLRPRKVFPLG